MAAYFACRRAKRNSTSALAFEHSLECNLVDLYDQLNDGSYTISPSLCFIITRPRPREVWAAAFRDRIVHHLLYRRIAPPIEASFIADSCACIPGRGTLYGARRLEAKARSVSEDWSRPAWYLKLDIANFFVSIDKRILRALLEPSIIGAWWQQLACQILFHDPRPDVVLRGAPHLRQLVPPPKRLALQDGDRGLPIGNLSSQFFANVYLDVLDRFVKHELRCRHYLRYVDDFVLLHQSPAQLNAWRAAIEAFLPATLGLQLNRAKTILQPIARGIDFVGQVIAPGRRTLRRRTARVAWRSIEQCDTDDLFASANSYFGLFRQATRSHDDRARLANVVRRRGLSVAMNLTKAYR